MGNDDPSPLESTASLLRRVRAGDESARDEIAKRYLALLGRWAHGRLPAYARDLASTDDLVQDTLLRALNKLDAFVPQREGALLAYLRQILLNRMRDEIRRAGRHPTVREIPEDTREGTPSPLDRVLSAETFEIYDESVQKLPPTTREAVILFLEFGFTYEQIAEAIDSTANAARMRVTRALLRLAQDMRENRGFTT